MPVITDLTVKKADNTTDVVYMGKQGAAGDSSPAIWRLTAFSTIQAYQPEFRLWGRQNQSDRSIRFMECSYVYPQLYTDTTTGLQKVAERARFQGKWTMSEGMVNTDVVEFSAQLAHLIAHATMKTAIANRFPPS